MKSCAGAKAEVIKQIARVGCKDPEAIISMQEGDKLSLSTSLLLHMGATVNQPYPAFFPSYPFTTMQPHGLSELDIKRNRKAENLVRSWGADFGCGTEKCAPHWKQSWRVALSLHGVRLFESRDQFGVP